MGRLAKAALAVAVLAPFLSLSQPLIEIDDARYAEVPREMVESGHWVTPTLAGMDYVEKPPLWYWMAATSYRVFGVSEAAARLPLAVLAGAGVLATAWLGAWLFMPVTGAAAGALLSSSAMYFYLSRYATPDMPLTVFLLLCTAFVLRLLLKPEDARWAAPAAWAMAALAFLSKGLVGIVFPAAWTVLLVLLYPKLRAPARALLKPKGPLLFLAIAAPWYLVMEHKHPGFLWFFFGEQHFQRFLTPKYNRESPAWFFLAVLPPALLPWAPAGFAGLARAFVNRRREPAEAALGLWVLLVIVFFSTSHSKLATYILPVFPHLALLAARACERPPMWARRLSMAAGGLCAAAALAAAVAAMLGWSAARLPPEVNFDPVFAAKVAALAFGALAAALFAWGRGKPALIVVISGWLVGAAGVHAIVRLDDLLGARDLGKYVASIRQPGDELWTYGVYVHGLPFYAKHKVDRVINWVGELHYAKREPENAARFGDDDAMRGLPLPDKRVIVVLRDFEARHVLTLFDAQKVLENRPVGRWVVLRL